MKPDQQQQLAEERTLSDLLAAALIGEHPAEKALERYCDGLSSPFEKRLIMIKYHQSVAKHDHPRQPKGD